LKLLKGKAIVTSFGSCSDVAGGVLSFRIKGGRGGVFLSPSSLFSSRADPSSHPWGLYKLRPLQSGGGPSPLHKRERGFSPLLFPYAEGPTPFVVGPLFKTPWGRWCPPRHITHTSWHQLPLRYVIRLGPLKSPSPLAPSGAREGLGVWGPRSD